MTKERPNSAW